MLIAWLQGKKTYIIGGLTAILGVMRMLNGESKEGMDLVLGGLGMMTIRAGISKS